MNASRTELANRFSPDASVAPRRIVDPGQGRQHGRIERLVAAVLSLVLASAAAEGADIKAPRALTRTIPTIPA